jgi:glycosyltransferase involved in cell wall biosynthesis
MKNKTIIVDGLCMSPYYDYYLCKEIQKQDGHAYLFMSSFKNEPSLFKDIKKTRMLDLAYKFKAQNSAFVKAFKVIEYIINLCILTFAILFRRVSTLHIEWLPLLKYFNLELYLMNIWKRFSSVKVVYTVHNILPHDTGDKYINTYRKVYELADKLICHANITKNQLIDKFNIESDKIEIIPHGPLFDEFEIKAKKEACEILELKNTKNVLILGYIRPYKGIDFLIDTWKEVAEKEPEANLIICGKAKKDVEDSIKNKIDLLGLDKSIVTRFKFIETEEVPLYHFAADIIVFPYKSIDQSGALYTAMAASKAIIATSVGGFKEVINNGENGFLVKYGDTVDFANRIIELLNNEVKREDMGRINYDLIENEYSWEYIAEKTVEIYKSEQGV